MGRERGGRGVAGQELARVGDDPRRAGDADLPPELVLRSDRRRTFPRCELFAPLRASQRILAVGAAPDGLGLAPGIAAGTTAREHQVADANAEAIELRNLRVHATAVHAVH